jgi:hypothetical protein
MNDAAQLRKMPKVRFSMGSARLSGSRIKMKLKQLTSSPRRQQTAKTGNTAILRAYRLAIKQICIAELYFDVRLPGATAFAEFGAQRVVWGRVGGANVRLGLDLGRMSRWSRMYISCSYSLPESKDGCLSKHI